VVICLERGADLHMAQLVPLPLTVSCFSEIQIGFTFVVPAHLGSPGQRAAKRVCVCVKSKILDGAKCISVCDFANAIRQCVPSCRATDRKRTFSELAACRRNSE